MAAERIRLTVSITPEVHAIFSRMAETAGQSLGKCIGDWLEDTSEGAEFVAKKMAEARSAPGLVMREMQSMARGLVDEADKAIDEIRRGAAARRAEAGGASTARRAAAPRRSPPASNTGGKVPREGGRKAGGRS